MAIEFVKHLVFIQILNINTVKPLYHCMLSLYHCKNENHKFRRKRDEFISAKYKVTSSSSTCALSSLEPKAYGGIYQIKET